MYTFNSTFIPSSQQQYNAMSAPNAFPQAASNPFAMFPVSAINAEAFKPSKEFVANPDNITQFPLTNNATFTPSTNSDCTSEDSTTPTEVAQEPTKESATKYKTELCKNWIEIGSCRYGKKCQYAHGRDELEKYTANTDEKLRTKNCRTFYQTKQCAYGSRCMFRHEHRQFRQIARHYYVAKLYAKESLFAYAKDQNDFVNHHESGVSKLSVFENIHAEGSDEEDEQTTSECASYDEDSELSFIEMEEDIIAFCDPEAKSPSSFIEESSLNTTVGSTQESTVSEETAHKLDSDVMTDGKAVYFDIASQLNHAIEGNCDMSFSSAQGFSF